MRNAGAVFWGILVIVGLALLAGWLLGARAADDPARYAQAEAIRVETELRREQAEALLPVMIAFYAGLAGVGVMAAGLLAWASFLYLRRRSRTVYPDRNGVPPLVVLRPGEFVVDAGALAGPLSVRENGPAYSLPAGAIPALQAGANKGAAATRAMRAWASHPAAPPVAASHRVWSQLLEPQPELPPVEMLDGDEAPLLRLLEDGAPGAPG